MSRLLFLLAFVPVLAGCGLFLSEEGRPCPCAQDQFCCEEQQVCAPSEAACAHPGPAGEGEGEGEGEGDNGEGEAEGEGEDLCATLPGWEECDGDVYRWCFGGSVIAVDCAAQLLTTSCVSLEQTGPTCAAASLGRCLFADAADPGAEILLQCPPGQVCAVDPEGSAGPSGTCVEATTRACDDDVLLGGTAGCTDVGFGLRHRPACVDGQFILQACPADTRCVVTDDETGEEVLVDGCLATEGDACTAETSCFLGVDDVSGALLLGLCPVGDACTEVCKGVACEQANTRCINDDGVAACRCAPGFTLNDEGACVDAGVCAVAGVCPQEHRGQCVPTIAGARCDCDAGFVNDGGVCRDPTPCSPAPCHEPNRAVCTEVGFDAVCSCSPGYEDADGVCADVNPCSPDPCTNPARDLCTVVGTWPSLSARCDCTPGTVEMNGLCVSTCPDGQHADGDVLEPNECAAQAAALPVQGAFSGVEFRSLSIAPVHDVDFFRVTPGNTPMLVVFDRADEISVSPPIATHVEFPGLLVARVDADTLFSVAARSPGATPSYQAGATRFYPEDDYSGGTPTPIHGGGAVNEVDDFDDDVIEFITTVPVQIRNVGEGLDVNVQVREAPSNAHITSASVTCAPTVVARECYRYVGSQFYVTVTLTVRKSTTRAVGIDAYTLSW